MAEMSPDVILSRAPTGRQEPRRYRLRRERAERIAAILGHAFEGATLVETSRALGLNKRTIQINLTHAGVSIPGFLANQTTLVIDISKPARRALDVFASKWGVSRSAAARLILDASLKGMPPPAAALQVNFAGGAR